ncbi:MAG: LpxI family protein [Caldiserica bacterium]|nr:LpxI family protein [Caldisericota bacterium]
MSKWALIAGKGIISHYLKDKIEETGKELVTIGIIESPPSFSPHYWVRLGELGKLIKLLKKENAQNLLLAGKIDKREIMGYNAWDKLSRNILGSLENFHDKTLLGGLEELLLKEGFVFPDPREFLASWLAEKGTLTRRKPDREEEKDLRIAWEVGKTLSSLGIGHTVVARNGAITAVEAVEGTDETILRGGKWGKKGGIAKVPRPAEDLRWDPPAIGIKTLQVMYKVGIKALVVGAGKTIIMEKEKFLDMANSLNISISGWVRKS